MGLTLHIAGSIGKFVGSKDEVRMTVATQKSWRKYFDYWAID